jgi:hypothetical protein
VKRQTTPDELFQTKAVQTWAAGFERRGHVIMRGGLRHALPRDDRTCTAECGVRIFRAGCSWQPDEATACPDCRRAVAARYSAAVAGGTSAGRQGRLGVGVVEASI